MLNEPMMEKLFAMRLTGMSEALKAQEQDPAAAELSFHERLAMLVDQQMELAREPGVRPASEDGETARQCVHGRDRLPRAAWFG